MARRQNTFAESELWSALLWMVLQLLVTPNVNNSINLRILSTWSQLHYLGLMQWQLQEVVMGGGAKSNDWLALGETNKSDENFVFVT